MGCEIIVRVVTCLMSVGSVSSCCGYTTALMPKEPRPKAQNLSTGRVPSARRVPAKDTEDSQSRGKGGT